VTRGIGGLASSCVALMIVALCAAPSEAATITFLDDFNDGNAAGWWLGTNPSGVPGTWRVDGGELVQDRPGDAYMALIDGFSAESQVLQADVLASGPSGYGGFTFWYQDSSNWRSAILYNSAGVVMVEYLGGVVTQFDVYALPTGFAYDAWHQLGVSADSDTGVVSAYLDGEFVVAHQAASPIVTGRSGLYSGNAGGRFDNVIVETVPEPATVGLTLLGLTIAAAWRRRGRDRRLALL
jgi:pectate lyase